MQDFRCLVFSGQRFCGFVESGAPDYAWTSKQRKLHPQLKFDLRLRFGFFEGYEVRS